MTADRPRVLVLMDDLGVGGAERSLLEICRRLERLEPVVCHIYRRDTLRGEFERAGVRVLSLGVDKKYGFATAVRRLVRTLRAERPDLVHSTLYRAGMIGRFACRLTGTPQIHTLVNEPLSSRRPENRHRIHRKRVLQLLDTLSSRLVGGFVANSRAIAESNARALLLDPATVRVIYRGRDPGPFGLAEADAVRRCRHELGIGDDEKLVLNVAHLRPPKRHEDLVDALALLLAEMPAARLVIAGEGSTRERIARRASELGVAERMTLAGRRDDVPLLLAAADVFVFPSGYEGHPGALLEAMFASRPIVASDIPVHRETLIDGETALLAPVGDPETLAAAIARLLHDPGLGYRLGDAARRSAVERFHIDRVARQHEQLYLEKIGTGARRTDLVAAP